MAWYPAANKSIRGNSAGSYTGGPFKGVLHTTEGTSALGAISAFKNNNSWPHFLLDYQGKIWQFLNTTVAARTLRNLSGGAQTNRDSAIQIEIVGFAGKPTEHPAVQMIALNALMRWIETATGVKPVGPSRPFATAYGQNHLRFTNAQWDNFDGWCGHCHVPENTHWDPGAIDLASLLPAPGLVVPGSYYTEVHQVPFTVPRSKGGFIVIGPDGGVFTYDGAPFYGSVPGLGFTIKAIGATWTPSGEGYWLLGDDGGVFSFGDAVYKGGFNTMSDESKGNRIPVGIVAKGNGYCIVALDPSNDGSPFDYYQFGT